MKTTIKVGDEVIIKTKDSQYYGEWAIVKFIDEDEYHIALWNGDECLVFSRKELRKVCK